jgi:glycerophosphodiester phosphodiesterase
MKFGKILARSQVPEWSRHYVNYKALKQQIKLIRQSLQQQQSVKVRPVHSPLLSNANQRHKSIHHTSSNIKKNVAEFSSIEEATVAFFYALDRELERVNDFFIYKRSELERRLCILHEKLYRLRETSSRRPSVGLHLLSPTLSVEEEDQAGEDDGEQVEMDENLRAALLETRDRIQKMLRFADLNFRGFEKILKK